MTYPGADKGCLKVLHPGRGLESPDLGAHLAGVKHEDRESTQNPDSVPYTSPLPPSLFTLVSRTPPVALCLPPTSPPHRVALEPSLARRPLRGPGSWLRSTPGWSAWLPWLPRLSSEATGDGWQWWLGLTGTRNTFLAPGSPPPPQQASHPISKGPQPGGSTIIL